MDGFSIDKYYCNGITLKFTFVKIPQGEEYGNTIQIYHIVEFEYDTDFLEFEQNIAEEVTKRTAYFYIPWLKHFELSNRITAKTIQFLLDVLTDEDKVQTVNNQLISQDIAIFSRGW